MKIMAVIILSYLLGSISPSYLLGKTKNIDIRTEGSGNAGTTNAIRVLGAKLGAFTFVLDLLKGIIAVILGQFILGFNGGLLASVFVVLGHNWPVFFQFKGGKGIATSLGVLMTINWQMGLICLLIALTTILITRYVSLGSILASISAPFIIIFTTDSVNMPLYITIWILASLSVYRHRSNIVRLYKGEEDKFGKK